MEKKRDLGSTRKFQPKKRLYRTLEQMGVPSPGDNLALPRFLPEVSPPHRAQGLAPKPHRNFEALWGSRTLHCQVGCGCDGRVTPVVPMSLWKTIWKGQYSNKLLFLFLASQGQKVRTDQECFFFFLRSHQTLEFHFISFHYNDNINQKKKK